MDAAFVRIDVIAQQVPDFRLTHTEVPNQADNDAGFFRVPCHFCFDQLCLLPRQIPTFGFTLFDPSHPLQRTAFKQTIIDRYRKERPKSFEKNVVH